MDHLSKNSGLDVNSMTVEVREVKYEGNKATASVAFRPKASADAGMSMNYTLERSGSKWVVNKRGDSGGHGSGLPDGSSPQASPGGELPAGHPPVGGQSTPPK
jgi:hypothetical protein